VQKCFDALMIQTQKLKHIKTENVSTKVFISHEVDFVNEALTQDGLYALKKKNIIGVFKIILSNLFGKPNWLNMDLVMKLESEFGFTSTFYWIVNKGMSEAGVMNADYKIASAQIQSVINDVKNNGFENGLHKSISDESFASEISKLNFEPTGNRYHFLKFNPHIDFKKIDDVAIKFDTSLGFAEELGFRNNFGLPYKPYNFETKKAYNFVECPLNIMDTTLHGYQKVKAKIAYQKIVSFVESNAENCVLSVLWHNNYFSDYKYSTYFPLYKKHLKFFKEKNFKCITQQQIIDNYSA